MRKGPDGGKRGEKNGGKKKSVGNKKGVSWVDRKTGRKKVEREGRTRDV